MPRPLRVLTARDIEKLVVGYAPAVDDHKLKNIVSIVLALAKVHGVMIVQADAKEYQLHLRYLTQIDWTP